MTLRLLGGLRCPAQVMGTPDISFGEGPCEPLPQRVGNCLFLQLGREAQIPSILDSQAVCPRPPSYTWLSGELTGPWTTLMLVLNSTASEW